MDFLARLTGQIDLISRMPYLYRVSAKQPNVRECILNKHTIIYYQVVNDEKVVILTIRNTRRANS
ncbi:type II toxin-antitoxin system RelE/ParE family toxin [Dyadobacter sandarakinus]|uniref:Type II toxin-antitoxin system RelE/ParE family toxin n=1 Tax=Dyadobacter sandarakinus TaxID=2747268 RepID=A0ABX7IB14_9BACT|nr:type II toxin-antitoxin system RelE/ParE family toxin [Dyadobacter sandarakinus]